ncbi:hypothetical protein KIH74_11265 [Kineosporia sp. J2-2]|uniref:Biotin carboxyl carrier protein of acetyl-CoA carboxylase n=1 Tax=Kineosporia corallincola TaxID=2835133 RepID=A0ABS5TEI8_9ACTN|nr:biotin/lipoyl-containing protein [Kineosporia corallincola]MBT0769503.1 hypothetical protein [Kineosporia corallincola]
MNEPVSKLTPVASRPDDGNLLDQALTLVRGLPGPLRRISVRSGDTAVEIDWEPGETAQTPAAPPEPADDLHVVPAPLVGTFYRAPAPGAAPFVEVGTAVEPGQTLGIVEAMKLLNPIVCEVTGQVVELLATDGEPVQFDQPLVRISPAG